jgi:phosphoenolpyruvate synthase/pyruvate phosphate dikinase
VTYVIPLDRCEPDVASVGGKAVGLGLLLREHLPVPAGFAVRTHGYREFVREADLSEAIRQALTGADSIETRAEASRRIRALFEGRELPSALREELERAYEELGQPPVAVRSSATREDAAEASFAGVHETLLCVQGVDAVANAAIRCWASLFTLQALAYFRHVGVRPEEASMGLVVQTMVAAEAAGVMLTVDPATGDPSQITIEASLGLGQTVMAGEVTPDRYAVDKVTLEIRSRTTAAKHVASRVDGEWGGLCLVEVPADERQLPSLDDDEIVAVAALGKRIERLMGAPQNIEWAIAPDRTVYVLQTRPETFWSRTQRAGRTGESLEILTISAERARR